MFPLSCVFLSNARGEPLHFERARGLGRSFHEFVAADNGNDGTYVRGCADVRFVFARGAAGRHGIGGESFRHGAYYSAAVGARDSLGAGTVASDLVCDHAGVGWCSSSGVVNSEGSWGRSV